jgi:hypothetical protein
MNRTITIYFLLFMLLVTGAFASMAQNNYGFALIGIVALCFALFFGFQLFKKFLGTGSRSRASITELAALTVLALSAAVNAFHIRVPFLNYLTTAAALVLAWVYFGSLMKHIRQGKSDGWVILYYLGLLLFLLSFALAAFIPRVAFYAELLAFACLLIFLVGRMIVPIIRNGWSLEKVLELVSGFRNRSFLVASLFFCMALYGLAVRAGALPPLYADAYPKVFFDMSGTGEIMEGGSRAASSPAQFKDAYERFVSRHLEGDPQ